MICRKIRYGKKDLNLFIIMMLIMIHFKIQNTSLQILFRLLNNKIKTYYELIFTL